MHAVGHGEHAGQLLGARRQHTVAAGDKFRLLVSCFDQFGNRTATGAHVEAALKGPDELTCRVFPLGSPEGREAVRDAEARQHSDKGSEWVVECGPVTAGSHRLRISMDGAELPGSPFMLDVEPGVADPLFSSVGSTGVVRRWCWATKRALLCVRVLLLCYIACGRCRGSRLLWTASQTHPPLRRTWTVVNGWCGSVTALPTAPCCFSRVMRGAMPAAHLLRT